MIFGNIGYIGVSFILAGKNGRKILLQVSQFNPILGSGRTGDAGHHRGKVKFNDFGVFGRCGIRVEKPYILGIGFNQLGPVLSVGHLQIIDGLVIDREKPQCGAVFRGHVGQGCPIGDGKVFHAGAEIFHKFFDYIVFAKQFGDRQHQIGCRGAFG